MCLPPPCIFGLPLLQLLHIIHALRMKFPTSHILIGKTHLEKVYHHIYAHTHIAAAYIAIIGPFTHAMGYLPLRVKVAPTEWCVRFKIYIGLVNELLMSTDWDLSLLPMP